MGRYYHSHLRRLMQAADERYKRLMQVLEPHVAIQHDDKEVVSVAGAEVRIAVDDFKTVLAEIRRLK